MISHTVCFLWSSLGRGFPVSAILLLLLFTYFYFSPCSFGVSWDFFSCLLQGLSLGGAIMCFINCGHAKPFEAVNSDYGLY